MFSIAIKRAVAAMLIIGSQIAVAAPPQYLQDPLLGLRYPASSVAFEPLPATVSALCPVLQDNEVFSSVWFIFAKSTDSTGRTYYVVNGYEIRHHPAPPQLKANVTEGYGILFSIEGQSCSIIANDARQVFEERIFSEELPEHVFNRLATDFAARLSNAFGGAEQLKAELKSQRVALDELPLELRNALSHP